MPEARAATDPESYSHRDVASFEAEENLRSGIHSVIDGDLSISVKYEDRGFAHTVVLFHAAVTKPNMRLPIFTGATITGSLPANRVFVSDPSLSIDRSLKLAWFAGSVRQPQLQDSLARIIQRLSEGGSPPVLFGASGGGFAALYYASRIPGALAIPVNPQTDIERYTPSAVSRYRTVAWEGANLRDTGITTDLVELYAGRPDIDVLYVQNTGDTAHMQEHYAPFMNSLPEGHRVRPLLLDAGEGHVAPPREKLTSILSEAFRDERAG